MLNTSVPSDSPFTSPLGNNSYRQSFFTRPGAIIYTTSIAIKVFLLLPLFIFILYFGRQQWRKNRSNSSASTLSHSDCFTYHLVLMELVGVIGYIITFCGYCTNDITFVKVGTIPSSFTWYGQGFFHILTCVEHYLAVVHPVTYLMLSETRGIRIRNITVGCVWLLSFVGICVLVKGYYIVMDCFVMILTIIIIPFCSLSVLSVLYGSGLGEQRSWKERMDHSKRRAFYTIIAMLLALLLRFAWTVVWIVNVILKNSSGVLLASAGMVSLPSTLILPLLFLQRAGKLVCCCENV